MSDENVVLTLPEKQAQSIPYPAGIGRWLLRLPLTFYRLGFGDLMSGAHLLILGTRGRSSGAPRYTPIEYRRHGSKFYVVSAWGERPQWFRNLQACPQVLVQAGRRHFGARAEVVTNQGEALLVLHLFRRNAPYIYDPLIARMSARERIDARSLPDVSHRITIVRLEPTDQPPDFPPLPDDYRWLPPLLIAFGVLLGLLTFGSRRLHLRRRR